MCRPRRRGAAQGIMLAVSGNLAGSFRDSHPDRSRTFPRHRSVPRRGQIQKLNFGGSDSEYQAPCTRAKLTLSSLSSSYPQLNFPASLSASSFRHLLAPSVPRNASSLRAASRRVEQDTAIVIKGAGCWRKMSTPLGNMAAGRSVTTRYKGLRSP